MRKNKLLIAGLGVAAFLAASLGWYRHYSGNSPVGVAEKYLSALKNKNPSTAYDLLSSPSKKYIEFTSYEAYQRSNDKAWEYADLFLKSRATDHVVVGWKELLGDEETDTTLDMVLEQGVWKVAHAYTLRLKTAELQKNSRFNELLKTIDQMLEIAPWDGSLVSWRITALMRAAQAMSSASEHQEAILKALETARETAKQWPNDYSVQISLARVLGEAELWQDAENAYSRAIAVASGPVERAEALVGRGGARLQLNRIADAVSDAKEALRLAPENNLVRKTMRWYIPLAAPLGVDLRLPEVTSNRGATSHSNRSLKRSTHRFRLIAGALAALFILSITVFTLRARRTSSNESLPLNDSGMQSIRLRMKTGFIFVIVIGTAVAGAWYWNYTRSPQYSFWMAVKAAKQHDTTTFERYVDIDGLTSRLIDQIMEQATKNSNSAGWGQVGEALAAGFAGMIKPRMVASAREQVERYIEKGDIENPNTAPEEKSSATIPLKNVYGKIAGGVDGFRGIQYVKKDGKIALVGVGFYHQNYDKVLVLDIKMRDKGDYWQIAEISNFLDLVRQVNELESERTKKLNASIIEEMNRTVVIRKISKEWKANGARGMGKEIAFSVEVMNAGLKGVAGLQLAIKSGDGRLLLVNPINPPSPLPPGQNMTVSWQQSVNELDKNVVDLYATPQEKLGLTAEIQHIKFDDGSELKLKSPN